MNAPSLPTRLTTIYPASLTVADGEFTPGALAGAKFVYLPIPGLTGVPSGYARQAQLEASLKGDR